MPDLFGRSRTMRRTCCGTNCSQHARQPRDRFRDETMNANGWSVLRVWHVDVLRDREVVLDMVVAAVEGRMAERMISSEAKFLPASRRVEP